MDSGGTGIGFHRNGPGAISHSVSGALRQKPESTFRNRPQCRTVGRIRYSHDRSLLVRGAVNGEPLNCSAYNPYAHRCGEFRPTGSAPGNASVSNPLPKPV